MELQILQHTGEYTGRTIQLPDTVFGIEPNEHAIYLDVKHILANQRQGTHKAKEKGKVAGSTRKIKKQKGSGTARAGSIKSPIFRGGGRIFGPRPRDYGFKLNKKIKQLARKSVLSDKAKKNNIIVLADFSFETPKTKYYQSMLYKLSLINQRTLLILPASERNIVLSSRNIPHTAVANATQINTYDLIKAQKLLISETALAHLAQTFSPA